DYTVIYFSDHGLSIDGSTPPHHCANFKECYSVPLIIMSNNDSKRIVKNEKTSAFNFISIYSKIIGVKPKGVTPFSFEKTTSTNVSVFKDDRLVNYDKLENQRAI
ncbi:sulfatase-like hydrolase/transferase, partial [Pluralibacter gergoviae]|nr:sulfatase-like hydrolase/transferase [Pluralibacter gergoviae]